MSLTNPNNGSSGSRHTELQALVDILRQLKKPSLAGGSATEATLASVYAVLGTLFDLTLKANWTSEIGNSTAYTYYAGIEAGNPSGTTTNIKTIAYKTGITTIFTQTIAYNAADLVISITTS